MSDDLLRPYVALEDINRVPDDGPCNDDPGEYVPDNREDNWHVY